MWVSPQSNVTRRRTNFIPRVCIRAHSSSLFLGGEASFPALSFSLHSTFSRWGSYQALAVASQGVRLRPAALPSREPHENHEWWSGLAVNELYHRDKASMQKALLRSAKCADNSGRPADPLYGGELQPLHGIQSQQWTDTRPLLLQVCGL